ncbi:MAG: 50S ribosomal protein L18 [Anaerolineales bacterium]
MGKRTRSDMRKRRHRRVRYKISGTADRPRLNVFRSIKQIYAQLIDDSHGHTIVAASSLDPELKADASRLEQARLVGELLGKRAKKSGVKQVVFDRGGYRYHGRVKALAEAARESGLEF